MESRPQTWVRQLMRTKVMRSLINLYVQVSMASEAAQEGAPGTVLDSVS